VISLDILIIRLDTRNIRTERSSPAPMVASTNWSARCLLADEREGHAKNRSTSLVDDLKAPRRDISASDRSVPNHFSSGSQSLVMRGLCIAELQTVLIRFKPVTVPDVEEVTRHRGFSLMAIGVIGQRWIKRVLALEGCSARWPMGARATPVQGHLLKTEET
jgi:hypothetical protein